VLAPWITPYPPNEITDSIGLKNLPPFWSHPLGTDPFGRDVLSRILFGARVSLAVALLASIVSATLGTAYGAVAGYYGGRIDRYMMRTLDALLSIPRILMLITIAELWGTAGLLGLVVLIGSTGWYVLARIVRDKVREVKVASFVAGAKALGVHDSRILLRHVLPNAMGPIIVNTALGIGNVIVLEAALSYLRIGVQPPNPSWGNIIRDGADLQVASLWWVSLFPGLAIVAAVIAFNLLGDALRDALDPRSMKGA
jgi:peptide/nickel transport system permease protein